MSYPPPDGYGGYPSQNAGYPAQQPYPGMQPGQGYGDGAGMPMPGGQGSPYPAAGGMAMPAPPPAPYEQPSFSGVAYAATAFRPSGMPQPSYGGAPQPYGGAPQQPPYGGAPQQPSYGGAPQQPPYGGAPQQSSYGGAPQHPSCGGGPQQPYGNMQHSQPTMPCQSSISKPASTTQEPQTQGTVKDFQAFNPQQDAEALRKAMKGFGTDEKTVSHVISSRSNAQRQKIKLEFATLYGKDLIKELKSELSGNYEKVVLVLLMPPDEFDAHQIFHAMEGAGTDESALIEILCSRTNAQIKAAAFAFNRLYRKDMEKEIHGETSGHFRRLLVSLAQGSRLENDPVNQQKAVEEARALYQAGEARWGTDESRFNVIFAMRSFPQLRLMFDEYGKISKRTMEKAIQSEMSGDLKNGMLAIVKCARNRPAYFAESLHASMKGLGTNDKTLIRIMVSRSEVDMVQIKNEFRNKYGKTLASFISDDCSGDYKKILLQLCGN